MAMMMSFVALSIDAMLPALGLIGESLNVVDPSDTQLIISVIFLGMGIGLMIFGPLSDSYGRKPAIYLGVSLFIVGCFISYSATSFEMMLVGRAIQGLGAASARVVTLAMIRDQYTGNAMAKIMSLIMIIFILVPALAPSVGQIILYISSWRDIFGFMMLLAMISLLWFHLRQKETLAQKNRLDFSVKTIINGIVETAKNRVARNYTLASSLMFGSFIGYLGSVQPIFQQQYMLGDLFAFYFGSLALALGAAFYTNSRLVEKHGMVKICLVALIALTSTTLPFTLYTLYSNGHPPLAALMAYLAITFFCLGLVFGNFNSLAVESLGHIAGVANSVISSLQTLISVLLGGTVAYLYNGTVTPLVTGFLLFGGAALLVTVRISRAK